VKCCLTQDTCIGQFRAVTSILKRSHNNAFVAKILVRDRLGKHATLRGILSTDESNCLKQTKPNGGINYVSEAYET